MSSTASGRPSTGPAVHADGPQLTADLSAAATKITKCRDEPWASRQNCCVRISTLRGLEVIALRANLGHAIRSSPASVPRWQPVLSCGGRASRGVRCSGTNLVSCRRPRSCGSSEVSYRGPGHTGIGLLNGRSGWCRVMPYPAVSFNPLLDDLGLTVIGQRLERDRAVLACRVVDSDIGATRAAAREISRGREPGPGRCGPLLDWVEIEPLIKPGDERLITRSSHEPGACARVGWRAIGSRAPNDAERPRSKSLADETI